MYLVWMAIVGLIAGAVAWLIVPGGLFLTMVLGIAGSLVGGLLARMLGLGHGGATAGLLGSIMGALVLLALYRWLARHGSTPGSTGV